MKNNGFVNWKGHTFIAFVIRAGLGITFLFACFHKIAHPDQFALSIATYDILPTYLVNIMAICLPWVELAAGIFIIVGFQTRPSALLIAGMMGVFTTALAIALLKGLDMSCGCFAAQDAGDSISRLTLLRDFSLLTLSVYVLLLDRRPWGLDRLFPWRKKG